MTVTGTASSPAKMRVMPTLVPYRTGMGSPHRLLDGDVDTGRHVDLAEDLVGLRGRLEDLDDPGVGADFELLARLLVDVRRALDGELLDVGRHRHRTRDLGARALGGVDDVLRGLVEDTVIVRLEADLDLLFHDARPPRRCWPGQLRRCDGSFGPGLRL